MIVPSAISVGPRMNLSSGSLSLLPVAARTIARIDTVTPAMRKMTRPSAIKIARTATNHGLGTTLTDGSRKTWFVDVSLKTVNRSLTVTTDVRKRMTASAATAVALAVGLGPRTTARATSLLAPCVVVLTINELFT